MKRNQRPMYRAVDEPVDITKLKRGNAVDYKHGVRRAWTDKGTRVGEILRLEYRTGEIEIGLVTEVIVNNPTHALVVWVPYSGNPQERAEHQEKPWEQPNEHGEMPGEICCQRSAGEFCYEHDRDNYPEGRFPIQRGGGSIPWKAAQRAYKFYVSRFGSEQSLERLAERGGFGILEFCLLYLGLNPFDSRKLEREYAIIAYVASMLGAQWKIEKPR